MFSFFFWSLVFSGVFRPVLLLPEGIFESTSRLSSGKRWLHTSCHVRHGDNLVGVGQMFVETICWFHPLVWWIGKQIFHERERACDEEVLRLGVSLGRTPRASSKFVSCIWNLRWRVYPGSLAQTLGNESRGS